MLMLKTIGEHVFSDLEAPIVFLIVAIVLRIINIVLGSIDAMFKKEFDWGKFMSGIEKMVIVAVTILMTILALNLFAYGLTLIDVVLPKDMVSAFEVVLIVVTWCIDLAKEVTEKIKAMKDLKYVKYDDILQQNPSSQEELG